MFKIESLFLRFFKSRESRNLEKKRQEALRLFEESKEKKRQEALRLFEESKDGKRFKIALSNYFKNFSKKNCQKKAKVSLYSIYLFYEKSSGYGSDKFSAIYVDAIYSFVLFKNQDPVCNIGFNVEEDNTILVKQIQGVKGRHGELAPLRWEKMLLQIVIDWARENGFEKISVIRAEDSNWYRKYKEERCKRMYLKYDVTARRMGFKYDPEKKVYSLVLKLKNKKGIGR